MKSILVIFGSLLSANSLVYAQAAAKLPQCQAPFAACQAAGYKVGVHHKGDKEGADMGLWVDCIDAVADGKKQVSGVDQPSALACKTAVKTLKTH